MIGVFDSGYGGLTILKGFLDRLPRYDYTYLGDNARAPYGSKSQEVIYNYTREAVDFLFREGCELVIIACNTASSKALRKIQQEFLKKRYPDRRVLGMVIPVAEAAADPAGTKSTIGDLVPFPICPPASPLRQSPVGVCPLRQSPVGDKGDGGGYKNPPINIAPRRIGVIGTRATVESGTYEVELKKLDPKLKIFQKACPLLVPLVEEGWTDKPETKTILRKYLKELKTKNLDALILGCTHYPFLYGEIKRIMGRKVKVLDSPAIVAEKLEDYLKRHPEIERKLGKKGKRIYHTTDDPGRFKNFGSKFLKASICEVKKVEL